jgi:hypothetical protein
MLPQWSREAIGQATLNLKTDDGVREALIRQVFSWLTTAVARKPLRLFHG